MQATIIENGNGLPNVGEMVYDATSDTVYRITASDGRISTNGSGRGNSMTATVEDIGSASDLTDDEWENIESSNYGIVI
jgi:hypothetical protein